MKNSKLRNTHSLLERVSLEVLTNSFMVGILYLTVQGVLQFLNSWVLLDIVYKTEI